MNIKVIKNLSKIRAKTIFRGQEKILEGKHSAVLDKDDEEERALYYHWLNTFGFIIDISERKDIKEKIRLGVIKK